MSLLRYHRPCETHLKRETELANSNPFSTTGSTYLDHAGTSLTCRSLLSAFSDDLLNNLIGNPHSAPSSPSAQLASQRIDNVRLRVLRLFHADPASFDIVFVANATAAIKLVAEALADSECERGGFWFGYHRDAHTSLIGVRELAARGSRCFGTDAEVGEWMDSGLKEEEKGVQLFAYPAQSNMNGRRLPLEWSNRLWRTSGKCHTYSLLDAAALVSTAPLNLSDAALAPDFTVLSFYKMFGFPDLGALLVRKEAGHILRKRRYFGGGTVEVVSCIGEQWHFRKDGALPEVLEDGTLPLHSILALDSAITAHKHLYRSFEHIAAHTGFLARHLYQHLKHLRHSNGGSVCKIYEDREASHHTWSSDRGPIVAFNLRNSSGHWISNHEVQKLAIIKNFHLRTGNLCNPGGVSHALDMQPENLKANYAVGLRCGSEQDILEGKLTGVIRVSFGAMSTLSDVERFLEFIDEFFVEKSPFMDSLCLPSSRSHTYLIDSLTVYPIKSCGGYRVPEDTQWRIRLEGLAWDREWCLVHQGTRTALSQKRYPRMALFKPSFHFETQRLEVRWTGAYDPDETDSQISIPLSLESSLFTGERVPANPFGCETSVCGDKIRPLVYASSTITTFFSKHLGVPVYLARQPSAKDNASRAKSRLVRTKRQLHNVSDIHSPVPVKTLDIPGAFPTPPPSPSSPPSPRPLLLANESPLLIIFLPSIDALNTAIRANGGEEVTPDAFRANIVLNDRHNPPEHKQTIALPGLPIDPGYVSRSSSSPFVLSPTPSTPPSCDASEASEASSPPTSTQILFQEDSLSRLSIASSSTPSQSPITVSLRAPCRRCQMVCVDQTTGERRQEPFSTLAKIRRWGGGVWFGVHAALDVERAGEGDTSPEGEQREVEGSVREDRKAEVDLVVTVGDAVEGR